MTRRRPLLTLASLLVLAACGGPRPATLPSGEAASLRIDEGGEPSAPARAPRELRVTSLNLKKPETLEELETRYDALAESGLVRDTDVWLLQEIETIEGGRASAAAWLADRIGGQWVYAPTRMTSDGDTHGIAIVSRFPIRDVERDWLPRFRLAWHSRDRAVLAATIETVDGPVRIFNVHLDTKLNFDDRAEQLAPVLVTAATFDEVVIGGDFNTNGFQWVGRAFPFGFDAQADRLDALMEEHGYGAPATRGTRRPTTTWKTRRKT